MSKTSAETALALFNRTDGRGDVLSIHIEDGSKLAALPKEMFADIVYPLFQWWVRGSNEEPSDPRDKMVFEGLKTHQTENAVKRGVSLNNWHENSIKGGRPKGIKKTNWKPRGNQAETKRGQLEVASCKIEDASTSLLSCKSASRAIASRGGLTPPVRNYTSPQDAKRTIEECAPPILSHAECHAINSTKEIPILNAWTSRFNMRNCHAASVMVAGRIFPDDISDSAYEDINETKGIDRAGNHTDGFRFYDHERGETSGENFAAKLCELADAFGEKNEDIFKRALLDAAIHAIQQENEAKDALILERLNKVLDAVRTPNAE